MATAAEAPQTQDRQTRKPWSHSHQTRLATGLSPNLIWNSCSSSPILESPAKADPHRRGSHRANRAPFSINNSNPCNLRSMGALQPHLKCNQKRTKTKPSAPFVPSGPHRQEAWGLGRGSCRQPWLRGTGAGAGAGEGAEEGEGEQAPPCPTRVPASHTGTQAERSPILRDFCACPWSVDTRDHP